MIYTSFLTWRKAAEYRLRALFTGLYGVIFCIIILGIVSLLCYVARQINAFFRRESVAAGIVTSIIIFLSVGWVLTFVSERHKRIEAQHRADSLAYNLGRFTQMYDTTETIVINGDTIRHGSKEN